MPTNVEEWLSLTLWLAAAGHFCVLIASFQVPYRLHWKEDLAKLTTFNRKLMWVHGGFAVYTIIAFGVMSLFLHNEILRGERAALVLALFIGLYWLLRIVVDFAYYSHHDWPSGASFRIGHVLLTSLFVFLSGSFLSVTMWHWLRVFRAQEGTMRVAITGGTGFVGRHLARESVARGNEVVLIARGKDLRDESFYKLSGAQFFQSDLSDVQDLARAFGGCEAVAHCAGINREIGAQTYQRVHIDGTRNVVEAARHAGVAKIVLLSFLRARPNCGSAYHESKWAAQEIVRASGLDYTIFKAGVIYGLGDHMLHHLSHALYTFPIFGLVGMKDKPVWPLAVEDLVAAILASFEDTRLSNKTVSITGPEEMSLGEAVRRVGRVIHRNPLYLRVPITIQKIIAWTAERTMRIPLLSLAQLRILSEGIVAALPACETLPDDLLPVIRFTAEQIRKGLPEPGPFALRDLRCARA